MDTHAAKAKDAGVQSLTGIIDRIEALSEREDVRLGDLVEGLGATSFLPFLLVPALIVVSPLSGIPLLPTVCGTLIAVIAAQMLIDRRSLWLPAVLMRRRIPGHRLARAVERIRPAAVWIDARAHRRQTWLVSAPISVVARCLCVICGAAMPFLELVPFSSSLLASAVVLFSVGFLARDGLFTLAGFAMSAIGMSIPVAVATTAAGLA